MTSQRKIAAILAAKPGKAAELESLLRGMVEPCRAEPGCLRWDLWQDREDPDRFVLDELYADDAAVAAHRATPHFQTYFSRINDLATRIAVVAKPFDIA
jgi:quinol monooxygenase YgiN